MSWWRKRTGDKGPEDKKRKKRVKNIDAGDGYQRETYILMGKKFEDSEK